MSRSFDDFIHVWTGFETNHSKFRFLPPKILHESLGYFANQREMTDQPIMITQNVLDPPNTYPADASEAVFLPRDLLI